MRILIVCEASGIVRDAFSKMGHDSWSCDLLKTEMPGNHLQGDMFEIVNSFPPGYWDFIGLHYPCTEVALCGNKHYGTGKAKHYLRLKAIDKTKEAIELCRDRAGKVYYENPKNIMGRFIGKRSQAIQPWQFGHPEQKETWLWLYGLKRLIETENVYDEMMLLPKQKRERIFHMTPSDSRGQDRSRTYEGIAQAMANQWG